jgi:hypothetical protein
MRDETEKLMRERNNITTISGMLIFIMKLSWKIFLLAVRWVIDSFVLFVVKSYYHWIRKKV